MNAAIETIGATSQKLGRGREPACRARWPSVGGIAPSHGAAPAGPRRRTVGTTDMPSARNWSISVRLVEDDLDRHALHHLDVVAGGVLGRQQAEAGAGAGLQTVDVAVQRPTGIGVDGDLHRLARTHVGKLRLLEVGRHPRPADREIGQGLVRLHDVADIHRALGHTACLRRHEPCVGQVELGRAHLRLGLRDLGLGVGQGRLLQRHLLRRGLRLAQAGLRFTDLSLRRAYGLDGSVRLRGGRLGRSTRLIELLGRVELALVEVLHPWQVEPRALGLGRRGIGLRLGLLDGLVGRIHARLGERQIGRSLGTCEVEIRGRRLLVGPGRLEIRPRLGERRREVARIDLDHQLAGGDLLIVGDVQRRHPAADLRGDRDHVAVDERVVRRDLAAGQPPVSCTAKAQ